MSPHVGLFYFSYSEICKMFYSEFFKSEKLYGLISLLLSSLALELLIALYWNFSFQPHYLLMSLSYFLSLTSLCSVPDNFIRTNFQFTFSSSSVFHYYLNSPYLKMYQLYIFRISIPLSLIITYSDLLQVSIFNSLTRNY